MTLAAYFLASLTLFPVISGQELPLPPTADPAQCKLQDESTRFDCYPESGKSADLCAARGCCWSETTGKEPSCYYPDGFIPWTYVNDTRLQRKYRSPYPGDVSLVAVEAFGFSKEVMSIKISDPANNRFVPPYPKLNFPTSSRANEKLYEVVQDVSGSFIGLRRPDSKEFIFDMLKSNLIFADQFLQLTTTLMGTLYGAGEHRTQLALDDNWTQYTLWNHDNHPRPNTNLYGSHPFVLSVADNGDSFGVYLHNSNAMELIIQPGPIVTWRTIGGILELYLFLGPTPADVIRQYNSLIGLPALPPYWALGFHLSRLTKLEFYKCDRPKDHENHELQLFTFVVNSHNDFRYGYGSANNTRAVWERMRAAKIPYDTQWNDIDYMHNNNDFTLDSVNFAELPKLIDDIHAAGMHYIPMLDPGISGAEPEGSYTPYTDAVAMDILVKNITGDIFVGKVWNNVTVFPDFTHPRALEYWTKQLKEFREKVQFDALWIDMNEPSNFYNGQVDGCPNNTWENPPYVPPVDGRILQRSTICMSAQQAAGRHYDVHNLYGISEADVTIRAAEDILKKRTFLISRATSPGIGRYAGHWSGDNYSDWPELRASIVELLTFSLYGVPFMGADICGFGADASRSLCNRWTQLGAFYPFARNHNSIDRTDQDPAAYDDEFISSARNVLMNRYRLLPYLYTLLYNAHANGDTVARPLFFEFPSDAIARKVDTAFLWGSGLYIVPLIINSVDTKVQAYLPVGRWFDFERGTEYVGSNDYVSFDMPFNKIMLLTRGGTVIPTQEPDVTTTLSRLTPFTLIITPDGNGTATGSLFWDDGESIDTVSSGNYGLLSFELSGKKFTSNVIQWKTSDDVTYQALRILGVRSANNVTVNGLPATSSFSDNGLMIRLKNKLSEPIVAEWI